MLSLVRGVSRALPGSVGPTRKRNILDIAGLPAAIWRHTELLSDCGVSALRWRDAPFEKVIQSQGWRARNANAATKYPASAGYAHIHHNVHACYTLLPWSLKPSPAPIVEIVIAWHLMSYEKSSPKTLHDYAETVEYTE